MGYKKSINIKRRLSAKIAQELCYAECYIEKIKRANSEEEIIRILIEARQKK